MKTLIFILVICTTNDILLRHAFRYMSDAERVREKRMRKRSSGWTEKEEVEVGATKRKTKKNKSKPIYLYIELRFSEQCFECYTQLQYATCIPNQDTATTYRKKRIQFLSQENDTVTHCRVQYKDHTRDLATAHCAGKPCLRFHYSALCGENQNYAKST